MPAQKNLRDVYVDELRDLCKRRDGDVLRSAG